MMPDLKYCPLIGKEIRRCFDCNLCEVKPQWVEADKLPSSTKFICPHCRERVYFSHGSSSKSRQRGLTKRCLYRFCPWCGKEVMPLKVNCVSDNGDEVGMKRSFHEWIASGAISEEIAKQRGYDELIRCKDCKYFDETIYACLCVGKMYGFPTNPDWFCAEGERRTE